LKKLNKMYDQNYYQNLKDKIQKGYQQLVSETLEDVERAIIKKLNKTQALSVELKEIEEKEKLSKESDKTTEQKDSDKVAPNDGVKDKKEV
jgi:hypothetical protein